MLANKYMGNNLLRVKERRLKLNLNQARLAEIAGVSQSLVAKVEAGVIDPSYTNATKILETLNYLEKEKEHKVCEVMTKNIISVNAKNTVADAIQLFKKHCISQVPVINKNNVVGLITEAAIVDCMTSKKNISSCFVKAIMSSPPPQIPDNTPISIATQLLRLNPILLITGKNQIVGVVTKSNLLDFI